MNAFDIFEGIIFLLFIASFGWIIVRKKRREAAIPKMSSEALRSLVNKELIQLCNPIVEELKSRDEDITFVLPRLLELALSKKIGDRLISWMLLK